MSDELDDEFDYDASVRDDEVESAKQSPSVNPSVERYNVDKEGRQRLGKRRRVQGTTGKGQHLSNHDQLDLTGSLPKLVVLDLDKTVRGDRSFARYNAILLRWRIINGEEPQPHSLDLRVEADKTVIMTFHESGNQLQLQRS